MLSPWSFRFVEEVDKVTEAAGDMKRVTIYLPDETLKRAKHAAVDLEVSFSELVKDGLEEYLKKVEKKLGK